MIRLKPAQFALLSTALLSLVACNSPEYGKPYFGKEYLTFEGRMSDGYTLQIVGDYLSQSDYCMTSPNMITGLRSRKSFHIAFPQVEAIDGRYSIKVPTWTHREGCGWQLNRTIAHLSHQVDDGLLWSSAREIIITTQDARYYIQDAMQRSYHIKENAINETVICPKRLQKKGSRFSLFGNADVPLRCHTAAKIEDEPLLEYIPLYIHYPQTGDDEQPLRFVRIDYLWR